jgi:hypothetical protein
MNIKHSLSLSSFSSSRHRELRHAGTGWLRRATKCTQSTVHTSSRVSVDLHVDELFDASLESGGKQSTPN